MIKCYILAFLAFGAAAASAGEPIEIPLHYEVATPSGDADVLHGYVMPSSRRGVYTFRVHKNAFYFALEDENYGENPRLRFDAGGNRNLSEAAVIPGESRLVTEWLSRTTFGPIELEYQLDGQTLPYAVRITFSRRSDTGGLSCLVWSAGVCGGTFEANGKTYNIWFSDTNFDGNCEPGLEHVPVQHSGDRFRFSGDRFSVSTEKLATAAYGAMVIPERVIIGDELYSLEVRTAERKAVLTPLDVPVAPVQAPEALRQALLVREDIGLLGRRRLSDGLALIDPHPIVHLPKGEYHVACYQHITKDDQGDTWSLRAEGRRTLPAVIADGRDGAQLDVGPPYSGKILGKEMIGFVIEGRGKERVVAIVRTEGISTRHKLSERYDVPAEPAFRVVTEEGEVVASGVFEYG